MHFTLSPEFKKNITSLKQYTFLHQRTTFEGETRTQKIKKKTGARGLRSILENILLKTMFDLPDMENVVKVTVDRSAVNGISVPIVTYGKKPSTSVA